MVEEYVGHHDLRVRDAAARIFSGNGLYYIYIYR